MGERLVGMHTVSGREREGVMDRWIERLCSQTRGMMGVLQCCREREEMDRDKE